MSIRRPIFLVALGAVLLTVIVELTGGALRAVLAAPLALIVPGSAMWQAIWPREEARDPVTAAALAVVLSLVFYIAGGLLLAALSAGYSATSIVLLTDVGVALLVAVALARTRGGVGADSRLIMAQGTALYGVGAVLALLSAGALALIMNDALPKPQAAPFVELHMIGPAAKGGMPTLAPNQPYVTDLTASFGGPQNAPARTYQLAVSVDRGTPTILQSITLRVGQTRRYKASATVPPNGAVHQIVFSLAPTSGTSQALTLAVHVQAQSSAVVLARLHDHQRTSHHDDPKARRVS